MTAAQAKGAALGLVEAKTSITGAWLAEGLSWAQTLMADRLTLASEQDDLAEDAAWWDEGHKEPGGNVGTCVDRLKVN